MSEEILSIEDIKCALMPIAKRYKVEAIVLFGSYAKGIADGQSDVDLIVFGGSDFRPTDIFAMAEEIRHSLRKKVDVYEIREINPGSVFYDTIFREGVHVA